MHEFYLANIAHHEGNAGKWLEQGRPDYAAGSARKAAKWRARMRQDDVAQNGPLPKTQMGQLLADHVSAIADRMSAAFEDALFGVAK